MLRVRTIDARMFSYVRKQVHGCSLRVFAAKLQIAHTTLYYIESSTKYPSAELRGRLVALSGYKNRQDLIEVTREKTSMWGRKIKRKTYPRKKKS